MSEVRLAERRVISARAGVARGDSSAMSSFALQCSHSLYHGLERWIQVKRPLIESAKRGWEAPKCLSRQCVTKPCGTVYVPCWRRCLVISHHSHSVVAVERDADTEYNSCDPVGVMLNAKKKKKTTRNKNKRLTWLGSLNPPTHLEITKKRVKKQLAPYWNRTSDLIITSDTLYH